MKKARGRLYNKKQGYPDEVTYGYFTKRDVLNFDKKFKEGKGEIKAFGLIPPAIGIGTAIQSQNQNKTK